MTGDGHAPTRVRPAPDTLTRWVGETLVVLASDDPAAAVRLSETAAAIWQELELDPDVEAANVRVASRFGADPDATRGDVIRVVTLLLSGGLLERVGRA